MPLPRTPMSYEAHAAQLRALADVAQVSPYGAVHENGRDYPLYRLDVPGPRLLVITTGFHGEERSGPLTIASHFREVAAHARQAGVGLAVFACINPSGFEAGTRYNASGERPNNDFLRYEVAPGQWKGELGPTETFLRFELFPGGPKETRAVRAQLEAITQPIVGALDIHQDDETPGAQVYAYTFGPPAPYVALLDRCRPFARIAAGEKVDHNVRVGLDGLIEFRDGSVTDYLRRRGAVHAAALETTTETPLAQSREVNLVWLHGFIDLCAAERAAS